jgi:hypothetical protein
MEKEPLGLDRSGPVDPHHPLASYFHISAKEISAQMK